MASAVAPTLRPFAATLLQAIDLSAGARIVAGRGVADALLATAGEAGREEGKVNPIDGEENRAVAAVAAAGGGERTLLIQPNNVGVSFLLRARRWRTHSHALVALNCRLLLCV